jgi:hypothetical protein
MAGKTAWKPATPQLSLVLPGAPASQFHSSDVEIGSRKSRRAGSLIRQALYLHQEDAYAAGEVGFLARALVQATLPHSDPKANETGVDLSTVRSVMSASTASSRHIGP